MMGDWLSKMVFSKFGLTWAGRIWGGNSTTLNS